MNFHKKMSLARAVGRNEIEKVAAICIEALDRVPHDLFALKVLADTYWRNGQHERALPFALRALDITPDDFDALRIVVHSYREIGDDPAAYQYAKRLCAAVPYELEAHDELSALLKPFSWLPSVRRLRDKAIEDQKTEQTSRRDWAQWAQDYVAWYETQQPA
jgi:tetratricopeptide (TPR) repeat protein